MFDTNTNITDTLFNSCVRMISRSRYQLRFSGLNPNLRTQGESRLIAAFLLPISRVIATIYWVGCLDATNRLALLNHGALALCKRLGKTGKWLTTAIGSRNERLIIKLHRLADNSTGGYGYNLGLDITRSTLRGSLSPKFMKD